MADETGTNPYKPSPPVDQSDYLNAPTLKYPKGSAMDRPPRLVPGKGYDAIEATKEQSIALAADSADDIPIEPVRGKDHDAVANAEKQSTALSMSSEFNYYSDNDKQLVRMPRDGGRTEIWAGGEWVRYEVDTWHEATPVTREQAVAVAVAWDQRTGRS